MCLNSLFPHPRPCTNFLCYVTNCHKHSVLKLYLLFCYYVLCYIIYIFCTIYVCFWGSGIWSRLCWILWIQAAIIKALASLYSHLEVQLEKYPLPSSHRLFTDLFPFGCETEGPSFLLARGCLQLLEASLIPLKDRPSNNNLLLRSQQERKSLAR